MEKLPKPYQAFEQSHPAIFKAYEELGETISEAGPLDQKSRELIKLGMAVASGSEGGVHSHTHRALEAGASREEIEHTIVLGVTTLGFPTMMAAFTWAQDAFESVVD